MNVDRVRLRLNYDNVCRFCLSSDDCMPLFINSIINQRLIEAVDVLLLKVDEHDGLPNCVCACCHQRMADFARFEATALEAYNMLRSILTDTAKNDESEKDNEDSSDDVNLAPQLTRTEEEAVQKKLTSVQGAESIILEIESVVKSETTCPESKARQKKACPVCGKLVSQISKHIPVHGSKTKHYACEQCDKRFANQTTLRKHLKIHRNVRNYRCEHCEASFCDRSSLRYHLAKHRGVAAFQCEFCDRGFYTSSQLRQHQNLAHRERKFRCDVCGQMFLLKHHLMEHAQLHSDGRPHECDLCGKAFKRERYLYVHRRRRHSTQEGGE
uniref:Protein krueppel n=1 Tax=Anopheles epiroticus TaxID=199890 RepID=A0A182P2N4_9DIPT